MKRHWENMSIMEPDWYQAEDILWGTVALYTNWEETAWLLCETDEETGEHREIFNTKTPDIEQAKAKADEWLNQAHEKERANDHQAE